MKTKKIVFLVLTALMFGSLFYGFTRFSNADLPSKLKDFRPEHAWLIVAPTSGMVLWIWALYDWGTRKLAGMVKFIWLIILIITLYFGALVYFICVGLKEDLESK